MISGGDCGGEGMGWVGAGVWGEHYIATQWCLSLFGLGNEIL
jgi:hypothetical protein